MHVHRKKYMKNWILYKSYKNLNVWYIFYKKNCYLKFKQPSVGIIKK